jgi:hypothetical protein
VARYLKDPVVPFVGLVPVRGLQKSESMLCGRTAPEGSILQYTDAEVVDSTGRRDEVFRLGVVDMTVLPVELCDIAAVVRVDAGRVVEREYFSTMLAELFGASEHGGIHGWDPFRTDIDLYYQSN